MGSSVTAKCGFWPLVDDRSGRDTSEVSAGTFFGAMTLTVLHYGHTNPRSVITGC